MKIDMSDCEFLARPELSRGRRYGRAGGSVRTEDESARLLK